MGNKREATRVKEPLQIYITSDERRLLDRLASDTGLSRAEVLRRGLRSFAREQPAENSPILKFMDQMRGADWPPDIGRNHDAHLEDAVFDTHAPRGPRTARKKRR